MTKDEALNLALEALLKLPASNWYPETAERNYTAIAAIKAALAQPEREIEITFLDWVDPIFGVMPVNTDGKKPLILRAKLKEKNE